RNKLSSSRRKWAIGLALLLLVFGAYSFMLVKHVEAVTYYQHNRQTWSKMVKSVCVRWHHKYVFGDLRPGSKNQFAPLELSCQQAVALKGESHFTVNQRGQKIHYLRYLKDEHEVAPVSGKQPPNPMIRTTTAKAGAQKPILLFVHGIAVNYITAMKFYP